MRVALVHDYLTQFGGAERVLEVLMEVFPHAPVYTLIYDPAALPATFDQRRIRTSFLQRWPLSRRHHRFFPLLMPLACEQFDFSEFDVVFSATHSFTKGVITPAHTMHVSYCFTPTRYIWDDCHRYIREFSHNSWLQRLAPPGLAYLRLWDYFAAQRVDHYLTLSQYVAQRIRKYYQREALVVAPPVEVDRFKVSQEVGDYYLIVSRLVPYKRIDVAIEACERLGVPLLIAGTGPEHKELVKRAGKWTRFLGFVPDEALPALYAGARALLFPQEEDFGITPLEAAAAGKPTLAFNAGGARETIIPYHTGLFFNAQQPESLMAAMQAARAITWDPVAIRAHAQLFHRQHFLHKIQETVHTLWMSYQATHATRHA